MRKRKRYCQRISEEGEKVRKMMEKYSEEQIQVIIVVIFHLKNTIYAFNTSFPFAERKTGSSIEERKRIQNTSTKSASFIEYATNIWHLQSI